MAKRHTISHIYAMPGLYDVLYNRNASYKLGEATAFAAILEHEKKRPKSILELLSGKASYHKRAFSEHYHFWNEVTTYKGLDAFADPDPNVIVAPVTGPYGETFDAIMAYYYTASTLFDLDNNPQALVTRKYAMDVYKAVFDSLNKGGVFILDACDNGYRTGLGVIADASDPNEEEYAIEYGHSLRRDLQAMCGLKLKPLDKITVGVKYTSVYDRLTGNNIDTYSPVKIKVNGKIAATITIEKPFCQRYFSEPEITQMLLDVGFTSVDFWSCDYYRHNFNQLDRKLTPTHFEDDSSDDAVLNAMANVFVARK